MLFEKNITIYFLKEPYFYLIKRVNSIMQSDGMSYKIPAHTDIYLIDQIMKNRYSAKEVILDAGCGNGRNMLWFIKNKFKIFGIDASEEAIHNLKALHSNLSKQRLCVSRLEKTAFKPAYFNHIICSAVLHFATGTAHFHEMISEMVRIIKPGGTLFIRMTSNIGIENKVNLIGDGVYYIPDGSVRFLLTKSLLADCIRLYSLDFIEPLKTVNVNDERCMSTLMLKKL